MAAGALNSLDVLLKPASVAVIGASQDCHKLGGAVLRSLVSGNFQAPVLPVNNRRFSVSGVLCYRSASQLPIVPAVAVICTPPASVPKLIAELGHCGTRVAVVMTGDPDNNRHGGQSRFAREILEAARPYGLRIVGPGSTGIQVPGIGFNCTWIAAPAKIGQVALISQSGSLMAGVVDWARDRGIGFSHVISAGDAIDLDVGDFLDVLGSESSCQAILLYIRAVKDGRKFLSAARAVARWKRLLVVKAGRRDDGVGAYGYEGVSISADGAFDAAVRRAGMLRVTSIDELFDAVETLSSAHAIRGNALGILTNGFGPATIAADTVREQGGRLALIGEPTCRALSGIVPGDRGCGNPFDLGRGASTAQFAAATTAMLADPGVNSLLVMRTQTNLEPPEISAAAVIRAAGENKRAVLACWLGDGHNPAVRSLFTAAGIPIYDTPDRAARGFLHLARFYRNQELLLQTPDPPPAMGPERRRSGKALVQAALARGERLLSLEETERLLAAYGMEQPTAKLAGSAEEAERLAENLGYPVAIRLMLPAGSVAGTGTTVLNLWGPHSVRATTHELLARFDRCCPDLPTPPVVVVPRIGGSSGPVVMSAGVAIDPTFGPMIRLGPSRQRDGDGEYPVLTLPPLNMHLAAELVSGTRGGRRLRGGAAEVTRAERALQTLLVSLSQMIVDIPEVAAVDFDPLVIDGERVTVIRAMIELKPDPGPDRQLAIRPYPEELEETVALRDGGGVRLRPIRPEDTPAYERMLRQLSPEDMRMRFFGVFTALPRSQLTTLIHIDYDRDMTIIATGTGTASGTGAGCGGGADEEILGMVNLVVAPRGGKAEYAVLVRSDQKGRGLGRVLMEKMVRHARQGTLTTVVGVVHKDNHAMLDLCRRLGFVVPGFIDDYFDEDLDSGDREEDDDVVEVRLELARENPGATGHAAG